MFTPKINTPRSNQSPFTPNRVKGRRSIHAYTPNTRSPFPGTRNQNRSFQTSILVEETPRHRLESYGTALPVLVTEALALAGRNPCSVQLAESGWAWLVCGRRLLVWRYKPMQTGKNIPCRELPLPPSDSSHQAKLVSLITPMGENHAVVSCVAVSPEGIVRYWANISHEGSFHEISTDLKGDQCAALVAVDTSHVVLATSTSSLLMLVPNTGQSVWGSFKQNTLSCRPVQASQGMLSGISRRMSSFIFGAGPPLMNQALHQVIAGEQLEDGWSSFYVLTGQFLQKWAVLGDSEKLLYQCLAENLFKENIAGAVWNEDVSRLDNIQTWLLDMQVTRDGVVILGAAVNPDVSQEIYYALGTLHTEGHDSPQSFLSFAVPTFTRVYQKEDESEVLGYRLLFPNPATASAYLQSKRCVICLSVSSSKDPLDKVEFTAPGDKLLGAGCCDKLAVMFSTNHGLVSLRETPQTADVSMSESSLVDQSRLEPLLTLGSSRLEELSMREDEASRLKVAFLQSCRGNSTEAQSIVDELFPSGSPSDGSLDKLVAQLSQELIDDFPASDPRWAESVPNSGMSSSGSLILLHQLEDKLKAHDYFIDFLKRLNLWERLLTCRVPERDSVMCTWHLLCEHTEKLAAAVTFRGLHTQHTKLVDAAIMRVLEKRDTAVAPGLTPQDVFYREVSRIDDILEVLLDHELATVAEESSPAELVQLVSNVNAMFVGMFQSALQQRQRKQQQYEAQQVHPQPEYSPWTATPGPHGTRAWLTKQHELTVDHALPSAHDTQERGLLFQQLLELTDLVLDGYRGQLESVRQGRGGGDTEHYTQLLQQYEQDRAHRIAPFMKQQQYERAASLAEKYCDFGTLVQLCETTDNQERLTRYMNQFQNRGFSDFVFKWYLDEGKRGKLMTSTLANHPHLSRFLESGDNLYMSWLHDIQAGDFFKAHHTLQELSAREEQYLAKKKTLLSLSKLACLAAEDTPDDTQQRVDDLNDQLDLILHQESLPQGVMEKLGESVDNMKVLSPKELIELYISDYNSNSNEFDFKKSLDLLQFINKKDPNMNFGDLLLHIWCRSILKDDWASFSADNSFDSSKDSIFFKTIELAYTSGMDLREYLPTVDKLLQADELGPLKDNSNFQFLVKAGFEQLQRIIS